MGSPRAGLSRRGSLLGGIVSPSDIVGGRNITKESFGIKLRRVSKLRPGRYRRFGVVGHGLAMGPAVLDWGSAVPADGSGVDPLDE